jgi:arylsulfatase A-like enzyme
MKYAAGILLFAAVFFFVFQALRKDGEPDFQRSAIASPVSPAGRFLYDAAGGSVHFTGNGEPRELKGIPAADACYFFLQGRKTFSLRSPYSGRSGFYSHVLLEADAGGRIDFAIGVKRQGRVTTLRRIREKEFNAPVFQAMTLARDEELEISCQGKGIVYFSKPVLYRIKEPTKRNYIFLIALDTLRADALAARVNGQPLTPNIDRFRGDSVDFARCYSQCNWTLPAFMSFFTGQYEFNHQMHKSAALGLDKPFLVRDLAADHVTINLNGGTYMSKNFGFARHFDYFESSPELFGSTGGQALFTKALDLIDRGQFPSSFMFLHTYQVHAPYAPPAEFLERINPRPLHRQLNSVTFNQRKRKFKRVDDALIKSYQELYQGEILAFDSFFGDFVGALRRRGIYDRSLIVLMSDHGEEFFEHGGWAHNHSLYAELLHVPLLVKFPGNRHKGRTIQENVGVIDILPTVLATVGRKVQDPAVDGLDLTPLLSGKKLARPFLFSSISNCRFLHQIPPKFAVFTDRYKVIHNYDYSPADLKFFAAEGLPPATGQTEIYDLELDPGDRVDLFARRKDVYQQVSQQIKRLRAVIDANLARKRPAQQRRFDRELQKQMKSLGYL